MYVCMYVYDVSSHQIRHLSAVTFHYLSPLNRNLNIISQPRHVIILYNNTLTNIKEFFKTFHNTRFQSRILNGTNVTPQKSA